MQPRRFKRSTYRAMIRDARKVLNRMATTGDDGSDNFASDIVDDLQDALSDFAPPYGYFGTADGDGACFGFFLSGEWSRDARDNDIPIIDDSARRPVELPAGYRGEWFHVSDHGNVTLNLRTARGADKAIWALV
jgi:hypothetical protein